ncbi:MAG: polysaccharide export protein [Magnetococcales bacterium]|nr:polysaccharide export protein [Magnetococcales bacterium]
MRTLRRMSSWRGFWTLLAVLLLLRTPGFARAEDPSYILGSGDKLRVTVYQETDLSGEFEINGGGFIALPLAGQVKVGGGTLREGEAAIVEALKQGFLKHPRVNLEVMNYRPFYILGEVKVPGSYPYVNGMNILKAVAMGGGFTYRANEKEILLRRGKEENAQEVKVGIDAPVLPGDVIRVGERMF